MVGSVVSSHKIESLEGLKLLAVKQLDAYGEEKAGSYVVAVDAVQAGLGEIVIYATGSAARQSDMTCNRPADAIIMGIVDTWDVDGKVIYQKSA